MVMKIRCQEHYDKVVEYAKSIGDTTFQNCIERLKQWEKNSNGRYEIELYRDFAHIRSVLRKWPLNGSSGIVGGLLYHGKPDQSYAVTLTHHTRLEYTYLNLYISKRNPGL